MTIRLLVTPVTLITHKGLDNCHDGRNVWTVSTNSRYTPPPASPVTAWARHIDAVRRERNLSQTATFRLLGAAVDLLGDSRSAFLPYLVDKQPTEAQAKALAAIIGWPPAEPEPVADPLVGEPTDLASALAALTRELAAMRIEVAALQRERAAWQHGVVAAMAEVEGRVPSALLASLAPQPS